MGARQPGWTRVAFRRAGATSTVPPGGTITSVASADGSITVTNGLGPAVDLSWTFPAYHPAAAAMQASGVVQQTYAAPVATPSVLTMVTGQVPFGAASGLLTQSAGIVYSDTIATRNLKITLGATSVGQIGTYVVDQNPAPNSASHVGNEYKVAGVRNWLAGLFYSPVATTASRYEIHYQDDQAVATTIASFSVTRQTSIKGTAYFTVDMLTGDVGAGFTSSGDNTSTGGALWMPRNSGPALAFAGAQMGSRDPYVSTASAVRLWQGVQAAATWNFVTFDNLDPGGGGRIPFSTAAHTLTDSAKMTWTDTAGAETLILQGVGPANVFVLQLQNTTAAGVTSFGAVRFFYATNTQGAQVLLTHVGGGANSFTASVTQSAPGAEDLFVASGTAAGGQAPLIVWTQNKDVALGASAKIAAAGTRGFVYLPTVTAPPTGVPTLDGGVSTASRRGTALDDTNARFYAYLAGAWDYAPMVVGHLLTVSDAGVGKDVAVKINSGANGISIGGGVGAGLYVADPNAAGAANIAVDDGLFGQWLVGYTALTLTTLNVGVGGANNFLNHGYAADRVGTQTTVQQMDSNNGRQYFGDTLASTKAVMEVRPTAAGTQGDVMIGWQGGIVAATVHGYPYIPSITATPTGAADVFGNPGAAIAYDTNKHGLWARNSVGAQWEFLPAANTTQGAGAGVWVTTNLPAGFGTTPKYWAFTGFGGAVCVVPYFTNP